MRPPKRETIHRLGGGSDPKARLLDADLFRGAGPDGGWTTLVDPDRLRAIVDRDLWNFEAEMIGLVIGVGLILCQTEAAALGYFLLGAGLTTLLLPAEG